MGEVVYKATIDTDGLTQDIKEAEKDIKKTDLGDTLSNQAQKAADDVEQSTDKMGESFKGAGDKSGAMQVAIGNAMAAAADRSGSQGH